MVALEILDASAVAHVTGHQDQIVVKGCCRDEEIDIRDELPLALEAVAVVGESFHDWIGEGGKELTKVLEVIVRIGKAVGAVEDLPLGQDADSKACWGETAHGRHRVRHVAESIDDPIAVEQVAHGVERGLVPSSRPR